MTPAAIFEFIEAQTHYDTLRRLVESSDELDLPTLNHELLQAYQRMESLARVVAGVDTGLTFAVVPQQLIFCRRMSVRQNARRLLR